MFNGAQIHLAINHMPVVGMVLAFLVLVTGLLIKNSTVRRTGLMLLVFVAITSVPAYLSGEPAEEMVEDKPGVTEVLIHEHEEAAELAFVLCMITGGAALLSLVLGRMKRENLEMKAAYLSALLSGVTFITLANVAHLGGLIRHDELRAGVSAHASSNKEIEHENDD